MKESPGKTYCKHAPQQFHRYYMYKPVRKFVQIRDDGSVRQLMYCRYCSESFESVVKVEKDPEGTFRTIREIRKVQTVIKEN